MAWRVKDAAGIVSSWTAAVVATVKRLLIAGIGGEGYISFTHQSADPSTPGTGSLNIRVFGKNAKLYSVVDDGAGNPLVTQVGSGGNTFEFPTDGTLTDSTTSFPCDELTVDPKSISCTQLMPNGWQQRTVEGLVWVTDDANKYLQGDISTFGPTGTYPVRITVQ